MAEKLDNSELVSFKELIMSNSIQTDAVAQSLCTKQNSQRGEKPTRFLTFWHDIWLYG